MNVGCLLLGLDQWRRDAFYTGLHADWIQATYPGVDIAVSAPRMRPHEGSFNDIHPASERDLVQYIQALRLYLPAAGITLSTRERPFLRDRLIGLGITKISAAFPPPWADMPMPRRMSPRNTTQPSLRSPTIGMLIR